MTAQASLLPNGRQQLFDANGAPLVGASVYFYEPGTSTPSNTWQDPAMTVLNTNPVVLDSLGSMSAYGIGSYRQVVKDAAGNQLWDEVVDSGVNSNNLTPGSAGLLFVATGGAGISGLGSSATDPGNAGTFIVGCQLGESLPAGAAVSLSNTVPPTAVGANASTGLECHGFLPVAGTSGDTVDVQVDGIVAGLSGLEPGLTYYLGTSDGAISAAGATGSGNLYQPVGIGLTTSSMAIRLGPSVQLPS